MLRLTRLKVSWGYLMHLLFFRELLSATGSFVSWSSLERDRRSWGQVSIEGFREVVVYRFRVGRLTWDSRPGSFPLTRGQGRFYQSMEMESRNIDSLFTPIYHHSKLFPIAHPKQCLLTQIGFVIHRFPQQFKSGEHILDKAHIDRHDFIGPPSIVHQAHWWTSV